MAKSIFDVKKHLNMSENDFLLSTFFDIFNFCYFLLDRCAKCKCSTAVAIKYSCSNITMTLIQISRLFYFGFFSKTNHQRITYLTSTVSRSKSKWYKAQKVQKYALNSQLQALQILTNDDEVEN